MFFRKLFLLSQSFFREGKNYRNRELVYIIYYSTDKKLFENGQQHIFSIVIVNNKITE